MGMKEIQRKIIELTERDPDLTVRALAARTGTDRDTVKDVLAEHLAVTHGTRLPQARSAINRVAAPNL
jgi:predicted HTH transcriptional regulator